MAASSSSSSSFLHFPSLAITLLLLLLLIPSTLSQDPAASSAPTQSSCQLQLSSLLPCTTFVQGSTPEPTESCCDNLGEIYRQQPECLCSLLNSSIFNSLPINRTLVLKLPAVCHLEPDASGCKMVSFRSARNKTIPVAKNNATVASSPMIQVAPRPTNTRGFMHSKSTKVVIKNNLGLVGVAIMTLLSLIAGTL